MVRPRSLVVAVFALFLVPSPLVSHVTPYPASADSASKLQSGLRRELRRMVGYTILASDGVAESFESEGSKHVRLYSGQVFKIDGYAFVMNAADVVVFGKALPESLRKQYPNLPPESFYTYKLLIDSDIVDASRR